jgi:V/A-type H+-transporting ATPase subunit I
MFYPQEMTEIEIIVPTKHLLPVTNLLGKQGVFSQTDVNYLGSDKQSEQPNLWQEKVTAYSLLERRLQSIIQALDIKKLPLNKQALSEPVDIEQTKGLVDVLEREVKGVVEQINTETKNIEHLNNLLQQLTPLADIEVDFSQVHDSRYLFSILGMMPPENIDRLRTSLARIPFVLYPLSQKNQKAVVWLASSRENADVLNRAARSAYLDPLTLPAGMQGTPSQIITSLTASIKSSEEKITQLRVALEQLNKDKQEQLLDLLWNVRCSHMIASAIVRYGRLKYTYVIVGWLFSSNLEYLKEKLHAISPEVILEAHTAKRDQDSTVVPTALNNPKLLRPFQSTVTTYAVPKYNELDPTPLVAILFPLLFGAMFGDVGHGAIVAIIGLLLMSKKVKFLTSLLGSLGPNLLACGISAMIFGFLYGSVMGFEDILHPIWMAPGANIMKILLIAIGCGVVILTLGFLLNIYNMLVTKEYAEAVLGHFGVIGLILYISMILFLLPLAASIFPIPSALANLPIPQPVLIATLSIGAIGVWFSEIFHNLWNGHRPLFEGGFGIYAFQGFFGLFEVVLSFFSNSLSFVRVGAFAVAHGNLAAVFFILGGQNPSSIGYWVAFLVGLAFIIVLEGLIVYIQTTRLTYYETFGKFFMGGGKRFEPLSVQPADNV